MTTGLTIIYALFEQCCSIRCLETLWRAFSLGASYFPVKLKIGGSVVHWFCVEHFKALIAMIDGK